MSDVSVATLKALHRAKVWLAKAHPGDTEAQAAKTEVEAALEGLRGAAQDLPTLIADAEELAADAARLSAAAASKSLDLSTIISAGKDGAKAWTDLRHAYEDFEKARAAALEANTKVASRSIT